MEVAAAGYAPGRPMLSMPPAPSSNPSSPAPAYGLFRSPTLSDGLVRAGSVYHMTLEEVEKALSSNPDSHGKTLGSINMSDFVQNIWNVEESAMQATDISLSTPALRSPTLSRQNSLALPQGIGGKTVEEVWRSISSSISPPPAASAGEATTPAKSAMTVGDFFKFAGVQDLSPQIASAVGRGKPDMPATGFRSFSPTLQPRPVLHHSVAIPQGVRPMVHQAVHQAVHQGVPLGLKRQHASALPRVLPAPVVVVSPTRAAQPVTPTRQQTATSDRGDDDDTDSTAPSAGQKRSGEHLGQKSDRKAKRMIKNRESAARSRARKQAYTQELEAEVTALKEDNKRLRTEKVNGIEKAFAAATAAAAASRGKEEPRKLRRVNSASW
eukprot:jgi/Chlat1/4958/Chrsp32S04953